jgi:hypothetical protein
VIYAEEYRSLVGVENLKMAGVIVEKGVGYPNVSVEQETEDESVG